MKSKPSPQGPTEIPKVEGLAGLENHFVGLFGVTGLTASIGMHVHGALKEGQTVVVSGAAGATGSVAGQYALRKGAKNVIGKQLQSRTLRKVLKEFVGLMKSVSICGNADSRTLSITKPKMSLPKFKNSPQVLALTATLTTLEARPQRS